MAAEPLGRAGDLTMVRWRDRDLPSGLDLLIAEASAAGVAWIADFEGEWRARPFLDDGEALFLAFLSSRPVGMGVISADPYVPTAAVGRLRFIYVAHAARGRGLLRGFVEHALARGHSRWRRLRLHTDNAIAARVYEGYGFRPVEEEGHSTHVRDLQPALVAASPSALEGA